MRFCHIRCGNPFDNENLTKHHEISKNLRPAILDFGSADIVCVGSGSVWDQQLNQLGIAEPWTWTELGKFIRENGFKEC